MGLSGGPAGDLERYGGGNGFVTDVGLGLGGSAGFSNPSEFYPRAADGRLNGKRNFQVGTYGNGSTIFQSDRIALA